MDIPPPETTFHARTLFHLELSTVRQAYNTARLPGDSGTTFSLRDLLGASGFTAARLTVFRPTNSNHGVRVLLAPLRFSGTGQLANPVQFEGKTFAANSPTKGIYQFNSWRVSYYSTIRNTERETWRVGGTLKVRDALISLQQGTTYASSYNLGVVPLVYFGADRKLSDRWSLSLDADGLAAPQGRAFDVSLMVAYALNPKSSVTLGVRSLEGGADNKRVYNFARLDYLSLGLAWTK